MKKFIREIFFFLLPLLAVSVYILFSPLDRKTAWTGAKDDCENRGTYLWQRIFSDTTPIDVAFLGTSRTINDVVDTLVEREYRLRYKNHCHVVNLGYCRFGNEMQYVIAKDLFANKNPGTVIIEINELMGTSSHPMYPYFATTEDILRPASFRNQSVPANYYNAFLARLTALRGNIFGITDSVLQQFPSYGYRGYPGQADPALLLPPAPASPKEMGAYRTFETGYTRAWITALVQLCKENGAEVIFLYIPSFHDQPVPVEGMDFYQELAPVLTIPAEKIHDKSLWRENDHMNDEGAMRFSRWLAGRLLNGTT